MTMNLNDDDDDDDDQEEEEEAKFMAQIGSRGGRIFAGSGPAKEFASAHLTGPAEWGRRLKKGAKLDPLARLGKKQAK